MYNNKRRIEVYQDNQSVRLLMTGAFKLTNEDWMKNKKAKVSSNNSKR